MSSNTQPSGTNYIVIYSPNYRGLLVKRLVNCSLRFFTSLKFNSGEPIKCNLTCFFGKCLVSSQVLRSSIVSGLEHLEMLILEAHPFLVYPPPPWGKLQMRKLGRVLKPREMLGLYNMNEIIHFRTKQRSDLLTGNITYSEKLISP